MIGLVLSLLLATPTTWFSLDRKRWSRGRNQNAVFTRSKSYASDSMYDYYDSDSVASENQPLEIIQVRCPNSTFLE